MSTPPLSPLAPSISDLLFDVIAAEILPRLPAKSLLRFKSVCKYLNTLISSPEFIRLHLRYSLSSHDRLVIIPADNRKLYTFDQHSLTSPTSAASATFSWPNYSYDCVGSCNGHLLITGFFRNTFCLVVLNPSTRTYVDVPSTATFLGFGYDHLNHDYKIVVVIDCHTNVSTLRNTKIYSVYSKSWKIVDSILPPDGIQHPRSGALVDNHLLHWMFWNSSTHTRRIGCFDVCLEKWIDDVPLPACYSDSSRKNVLLEFGAVEGRLFTLFENRVDLSYDVWVMKEHGVQESWTKLLSVAIAGSGDLKGGVVPVACRGADSNGQVLLLKQRSQSNLFWYNRVDGVLSKVDVPDFWNSQPYICNASLVVLPGAKRFGAEYEPPIEQ